MVRPRGIGVSYCGSTKDQVKGSEGGDRCARDPQRLCRKYASLPPSFIGIAPFSVMNKKWKENAMTVIPDVE